MVLRQQVRIAPSLVLGTVNHPPTSIRMCCRNARMSRAGLIEVEATEERPQESLLPIARFLSLRCRWCEVLVVVVDITSM